MTSVNDFLTAISFLFVDLKSPERCLDMKCTMMNVIYNLFHISLKASNCGSAVSWPYGLTQEPGCRLVFNEGACVNYRQGKRQQQEECVLGNYNEQRLCHGLQSHCAADWNFVIPNNQQPLR